MSLSRTIQNRASRWMLSTKTQNRLRALARLRRRLSGSPRRVHYYHQADDPYSHLACQILGQLAERYDIELVIRLVGPPDDAAAPDRERLITYSRFDAACIAEPFGLEFSDPGHQPSPENLQRAREILAPHLHPTLFAKIAWRVGAALWRDDTDEILALANEFGTANAEETDAAIAAGNQERRRLRHYNAATFYFEGEWYWGVDRLHYLEQRLIDDGARRGPAGAMLVARREVSDDRIPAPAEKKIVLEYFPSLRSPYSAISTARSFGLAERLPIELVLKPVLPMVMRGLAVPVAKRLYIVRDTKREADFLGIAFGDIHDPVGRPVERAFSLYPFAKRNGRGGEFLTAFLQDSFAGGIDTGTDEGLRHVVERAGLLWSEAREFLDTAGWREELEANREEMLRAGIWGVPSYRVRSEGEADFAVWGQDRIWLVEREIRRRLAN
ncbi:MAG: DsbA family protein [Deltaproteobacteria bacterium]